MSSKKTTDRKTNETSGDETVIQQSLGPNDVLLGRGTWPNETPGNVKFRALIKETIVKFDLKTGDGKSRTAVARKIILDVKDRGGKFLEKSEGYTFRVVKDTVALDKTKQSLRRQIRMMGGDAASSTTGDDNQHDNTTLENDEKDTSDGTKHSTIHHAPETAAAPCPPVSISPVPAAQGTASVLAVARPAANMPSNKTSNQSVGRFPQPMNNTPQQQAPPPAAGELNPSSGILAVLAARCQNHLSLLQEQSQPTPRSALDGALLVSGLIGLTSSLSAVQTGQHENTLPNAATLPTSAPAPHGSGGAASSSHAGSLIHQEQGNQQRLHQDQLSLAAARLYEQLVPFLPRQPPAPPPPPPPIFAGGLYNHQQQLLNRNRSNSEEEDALDRNSSSNR